MPLRRTSLVALLLWLGWVATVPAQVYNSVDYVRSLYHKYLNREPSSNELTQWVWSFQKGLSVTEAQVTFLSSDEYFSRHQRTPDSFVAGLYAEMLNRAPSPGEVTEWVNNLSRFGGNRQTLVREFLKAADRETSERVPLPAPGSQTKDGQLTATARLLRDAVEDELGGTSQGRQLTVMGRNLVNASRSLERTMETSPNAYLQAYTDVRNAVSPIESELGKLGFSSPNSSAYLDRFLRLLASVDPSPSRPVPLPSASRPQAGGAATLGPNAYNEILRLSTALSADAQQILYLLRSMFNLDSFHSQLLRDIEFFYSQVDAFHHSLRVSMPVMEVRSGILRLRALAGGVSQNLRQGNPAGVISQRWNNVMQDLRQMGDQVGVSAGPVIDPGQPVLYNAPTYNQLPYQILRPTPMATPIDLAPNIDEAVAHLNAFIVGFNRFLPYSARVPILQAQGAVCDCC